MDEVQALLSIISTHYDLGRLVGKPGVGPLIPDIWRFMNQHRFAIERRLRELNTPIHSSGCSDQNVLSPTGIYDGAAECGCNRG